MLRGNESEARKSPLQHMSKRVFLTDVALQLRCRCLRDERSNSGIMQKHFSLSIEVKLAQGRAKEKSDRPIGNESNARSYPRRDQKVVAAAKPPRQKPRSGMPIIAATARWCPSEAMMPFVS
jgi:hypothetical protein